MIDILILGAGWTCTFLVPLCEEQGLTYACTSRSGSENTIPFNLPDSADFTKLPNARTILVTFPLKKGWAKLLLEGYGREASWIALGTTSIWCEDGWNDRHSPYSQTERAQAEAEFSGTVLCLAGLWGGQRDPHNYVQRVAPTKEALATKASLHLIHGHDVARAIIAVHHTPSPGRWLLTDRRIYDWWDLASAWSTERATWVSEMMKASGVRALPRDASLLGRMLDSGEFWETYGLQPEKARV